MDVLLSMKPEFARKILEGTKKYEFRRRFRKPIGDPVRIFMYASAPVKKIVGYFTVKQVVRAKPGKLWEQCRRGAGTKKSYFFQYFARKEEGNAIEVGAVATFPKPIDPREVLTPDFRPPQSYCYLDATRADKLLN